MKNEDFFEENNVLGIIFYLCSHICSNNWCRSYWTYLLHGLEIYHHIIILSFAGFTYKKKDKFEFCELGSVLKKDLILGDWMGLIIRFLCI